MISIFKLRKRRLNMEPFELVLGIFAVLFGITALIVSYIALKKLTPGLLATYVQWIIFSIFVFTLHNLWHTLREAMQWKENIGNFMEYPEYILSIIAFMLIVFASFHLFKLASVFGFKDKVENGQFLQKRNELNPEKN